MPGINFKQMWSNILMIWKFFETWLDDPYEIVTRVVSGILRPTYSQDVLGFIWVALVCIALVPPVLIASFVIFLVTLPFYLAAGAARFLASPVTSLWVPVARRVTERKTEISDSLRVFSQQTWLQRLLSVGGDLLTTVIGFVGVFLFICVFWIGIFLWWGGILASAHLVGYGFFNGRDDASTGINSFTAVCNYRNLTQQDMISMTFDTSAARKEFSCPAFKRMGKSRDEKTSDNTGGR